tara:strand:+ start:156 stop:596 length:441 start_codon:yes stop_codon:yes gene_type:complete
MTSISIEKYSEKSFVVRGDTQLHKDKLKNLGGKWNPKLTGEDGRKFCGWIFSNSKRESVDEWFNGEDDLPEPQGEIKRLKEEIEKMTEKLKYAEEESKRKDELLNYIVEKYDIEETVNVCGCCNEWFLFEEEDIFMCEKCTAIFDA